MKTALSYLAVMLAVAAIMGVLVCYSCTMVRVIGANVGPSSDWVGSPSL